MAPAHPSLQKYPADNRWYVLYVKSRSEKKASARIEKKQVEVFLPLIKTVRQWSDRKKYVQVPLFNGYLFVHTRPDQFAEIKMTEGVVDFVKQEGKYAIVKDEDIQNIRQFIETGLHITTSTELFRQGEKVKINFGPLKDCEGELIDIKNEKQFIIRLEVINQVLIVSVPLQHLSRI